MYESHVLCSSRYGAGSIPATTFQVPPEKLPKQLNELLAMKWQLQWRPLAKHQYLNTHYKNKTYLKLSLKLVPSVEFQEKLDDVWIDPKNVALRLVLKGAKLPFLRMNQLCLESIILISVISFLGNWRLD